MNLNIVILMGKIGRDPEYRAFPNGGGMLSISLATNEYKLSNGKWEQTTTWHNVKVFNELAERLSTTAKKGMGLFVEGKIHITEYTTKDGQTKKIFEILAKTAKLDKSQEAPPQWGDSGWGQQYEPKTPSAPIRQPQPPQKMQRVENLTYDVPF